MGGSTTADNLIGTVDVSGLSPLLAAATWKRGGRSIHKGEFHLVFDDGTHIRWRAPGTYFLVEGHPGYFVFTKGQQESVDAYMRGLLTNTIVPWRTTKYAQPNSAGSHSPAEQLRHGCKFDTFQSSAASLPVSGA